MAKGCSLMAAGGGGGGGGGGSRRPSVEELAMRPLFSAPDAAANHSPRRSAGVVSDWLQQSHIQLSDRGMAADNSCQFHSPLHGVAGWRRPLSARLWLAMFVLKLFGVVTTATSSQAPAAGDERRLRSGARFPWHGGTSFLSPNVTQRFVLTLWVLITFCVNAVLFVLNMQMVTLYKQVFDVLHPHTICSIINGSKPFVVLVNMLIFLSRAGAHGRLLRRLTELDQLFGAEFGRQQNAARVNLALLATALGTFLFMFAYRVSEFHLIGERLGASWLGDVSLLLVPVLSVWAVLPLAYFECCNRMIRFWCRQMKKSMQRNGPGDSRPVKFYYEQFLRLTEVQEAQADVFNPFVLFSLFWSVFILCLTIYFVTQSDEHFPPSPEHIPEAPKGEAWRRILLFNMGYGLIQVILAAAYVVIICFTGTRTNEETRNIMRELLARLPIEDTAADRFYVTCFMYKLNAQYMWGVTVWRAFPLERGAFFTLVSLVLTYSFILLKFRQSLTVVAGGMAANQTALSLATHNDTAEL